MTFSLLIRLLEITFVEDLHDYVVFGHLGSEGILEVLLLREFTLGNISVDLFNLEYLREVRLLLGAPIDDFVWVASKFELLSAFL